MTSGPKLRIFHDDNGQTGGEARVKAAQLRQQYEVAEPVTKVTNPEPYKPTEILSLRKYRNHDPIARKLSQPHQSGEPETIAFPGANLKSRTAPNTYTAIENQPGFVYEFQGNRIYTPPEDMQISDSANLGRLGSAVAEALLIAWQEKSNAVLSLLGEISQNLDFENREALAKIIQFASDTDKPAAALNFIIDNPESAGEIGFYNGLTSFLLNMVSAIKSEHSATSNQLLNAIKTSFPTDSGSVSAEEIVNVSPLMPVVEAVSKALWKLQPSTNILANFFKRKPHLRVLADAFNQVLNERDGFMREGKAIAVEIKLSQGKVPSQEDLNIDYAQGGTAPLTASTAFHKAMAYMASELTTPKQELDKAAGAERLSSET